MKYHFRIIYLTLVLAAFAPRGVRAQCGDSGGAIGCLSNPISANSIPQLVSNIIQVLLGTTGALALLMFVYGGILWMTSGGNQERITKGKNTLVWATLGIMIIFSSYAILKVVFKAFEGSPP